MRKFAFIIAAFLFVITSAFSAEAGPRRIVSLSPVGTEILFALGQGNNVIGVTDFCDYPEEAKKKPKVGDYATINFEALLAMKTDLLVLSDIHMQYAPQLDKLRIKYVIIRQENVSDVYASIEATGKACGEEKLAKAITAKMRADIESVRRKVKGLSRPRVVLCVSRELSEPKINTFYAAGGKTFYSELIAMAGGTNAVEETRAQYPTVALEGLIKINPDVIIDVVGERTFYHAMENVDLDKVFNEKYLKGQWKQCFGVNAAKNDRIYILDGTVYLRPGPRMGKILTAFAKSIHPEVKW